MKNEDLVRIVQILQDVVREQAIREFSGLDWARDKLEELIEIEQRLRG